MRGMRRIDRDGRLKGEQTVEFHSDLPFYRRENYMISLEVEVEKLEVLG
jgi:hypothetical protein